MGVEVHDWKIVDHRKCQK